MRFLPETMKYSLVISKTLPLTQFTTLPLPDYPLRVTLNVYFVDRVKAKMTWQKCSLG